ncbi:alpha/beta-hydrolase [Dichomitus squalens LYAD-421 SS1]|uniref:alpha/beta-hydrolase n=1 Tax=Dichomitus squalens (strain LYAD-421) TaxID=732165 RepID=UPI000441534A|nr:alpha/beta-hydrolase [Dichomitus squalens LYAD-421 SS1]EJF64737.1 alpha/beta-hydrolase [Dichomitus squalens LYAD-421 SS1]
MIPQSPLGTFVLCGQSLRQHLAKSCRQQIRAASSAVSPVELRYDKIVPPDGNETDRPLVILHGLFGTRRNFGSLTKAFAKDLGRPVYTLDLRNHGMSPHAEPHTYPAMAADVLHFFQTHKLSNISLLGHSMGGKVAMTVALDPDLPRELLAHLIIEDIAPARRALSSKFQGYIEAMKKIEANAVRTRQEADRVLKPYEQDPMIRAFLLMNLEYSTAHQQRSLKFGVPVGLLGDSIPEIGDFPWSPGERTFDGPTLFIKGKKSKYINRNNIDTVKSFFPSMIFEELDTGHMVHPERPNEFKALVTNFIQSN